MATIRRISRPSLSGAPVALVLPGASYTVQAPLLYWPVLALAEAGWDVWGVDWHSDIDLVPPGDMLAYIETAVQQAEDSLPADPEIVIAKSLGTYALPHFAKRQVLAAWLTPILSDPVVAGALSEVSSGQHLAVGGTADPLWRPDLLSETKARLVSVESANHRLEIAGAGWRESADAQRRIIDCVIDHLGLD